MARQAGAGKGFKFQNMQIFKKQPLGIGSYGSVYRAKCDQLLCAAKLLHPVLVNPLERRNLDRFEQECHFLSGIRHPHIVQYLGTFRDPESGLPVLLMEFMDDSLTHFLEESQEQLPYHLEVNFCHDIALALAYLHSNGIIHRDLSSNNVLLIAGSRAKVTDFGMSKLIDATPRITPLTQCPGTIAYMSPEAVREPPMYTDKLDCFAHGVMAIQIMTREFPDPGSASHLVEYPQSPTGMTSVPILETERRKSHIDRIDPNHALLPIAIQCLSYSENDRPSAQQLCHQLVLLKEAPRYVQSRQQVRERGRREQSLTADMEAKNGRIAELQRIVAASELEIRGLREKLHEKDATIFATQQDNQQITQVNQQLTQDNQRLARDLRDRDHQLVRKERQLRDNEQIIAEFQQTLIEKDMEMKALRGTQEAKPVLQQTTPEAINPARGVRLRWKEYPKAPCKMYGELAITDGYTAYFSESRQVYTYDSNEEKWSKLPYCPQMLGTLAIVKGLLTVVGGEQSNKLTNTLLSLSGKGNKRKWSKHFPPMLTKRWLTAVVCSGKSLIIAGGEGDNNIILSTVEVMDIEHLQWSTANSLPHPLSSVMAIICGENLYLLAGYDKSGKSKSVFTCSLSDLIQSCQPQSQVASQKTSLNQGIRVWHKLADISVYQSTCINLHGRLVAVGGCDSDEKPTSAIHEYDPVKNTWAVVSHMPTPRYRSLATVLPEDRLIVVGGCTSTALSCDVVEIGCFGV